VSVTDPLGTASVTVKMPKLVCAVRARRGRALRRAPGFMTWGALRVSIFVGYPA
jgi:hypothetical protein